MLGDDLKNNLFVGDINNGNLYFLKIDSNRSGININNNVLDRRNEKGLQDLVVVIKMNWRRLYLQKDLMEELRILKLDWTGICIY